VFTVAIMTTYIGVILLLVGGAMIFFPRKVQAIFMRETWTRPLFAGPTFVIGCIATGLAFVAGGIAILPR
jgi:Na+/proline symporter